LAEGLIECHCGKSKRVGFPEKTLSLGTPAKSGFWDCPKCGCSFRWHDLGDRVEIEKVRDCGRRTYVEEEGYRGEE
jgi:hypothetical protein